MIPLHDNIRSRRTPYVNYLLILLCFLVFIVQLAQGDRIGEFVRAFGVVPANVVSVFSGEGRFSFIPIITLVSSIFLHGGWFHLLGNMLFLYVFGDNVEDRIGHGGYVLFYLLSGVGASLAEVAVRSDSTVPLIGASGAIAGVLGAYFLLYPRARVLTLIPLVVFFPVVELPAFLFLGFWFLVQFVQGLLAQGVDTGGGIAWWAHAGGFIVGAVLLPIFLMARRYV